MPGAASASFGRFSFVQIFRLHSIPFSFQCSEGGTQQSMLEPGPPVMLSEVKFENYWAGPEPSFYRWASCLLVTEFMTSLWVWGPSLSMHCSPRPGVFGYFPICSVPHLPGFPANLFLSQRQISLPLKIMPVSVYGEVQSNREETTWDPLGNNLEHWVSALVKSWWHSKITPRRLGKAPMPRPHPNQVNQDLWKWDLDVNI